MAGAVQASPPRRSSVGSGSSTRGSPTRSPCSAWLRSALIGGRAALPSSLLGWASAITSGVLYYAAAYWFYLTGLRAAPAFIAAASFYLIPVFGVAASFILLGERFDLRQWLGVVVVVGAVIALARAQAKASAPELAETAPVGASGA